jgi:pimeloyl-ACP methyl ester carboxylesterase
MPITLTRPVDPGEPEPCGDGLHPDYLTMPEAFKMCQGHRWLHEGVREWDCDFLIEPLRNIAALKVAQLILEFAAIAYYWVDHPHEDPNQPQTTLAYANAVADLAVTGRAAYASFLGSDGTGIRESDLLISSVRFQLRVQNRDHTPSDEGIVSAIRQALDRAYTVAWALRGPTSHRITARSELGWLAVSALNDPPHRPVNVPSAQYYQHQIDVTVPTAPYRADDISISTRYTIIAENIEEPEQTFNLRRPPSDYVARIPSGHDVIIFIHGHSSRAEEALDLAPKLIEKAQDIGRNLAVIAFDLPSNGYSSMVEHERVASWADSQYNPDSPIEGFLGYPVLEFIEEFIVQFVERLAALGIVNTERIVAVMGGSLGGNMSLRLSRRDFERYPWLKQAVAWSPASTWGRSWALAELADINQDDDPYYDFAKHESVRATRDRMKDSPSPSGEDQLNKRREYFDNVFDAQLMEEIYAAFAGSPETQPERWYSDVWDCKADYIRGAYLDRHEIYNDAFRRWHWRVAHEQLIFMHEERISISGPFSYDLIHSRLLLASGAHDNYAPDRLYPNTQNLAKRLQHASGTTLWLENTGHSIHAERPDYFANEIIDFLEFPIFLAEASWAHAHDVTVEHPERLESIRHIGSLVSVRGRPGQETWLHFAVPTPVIVDDQRLSAGSVMLRYRTSASGAYIGAVHIYDGERNLAAYNNLSARAETWRFRRFDIPEVPTMHWGLGISLKAVFEAGDSDPDGRRIEISAVGCDFIV